MKITIIATMLLALFAFSYTESGYTVEVRPGDALECWIEGVIDSTDHIAIQPDALLFPESYRLKLLGLTVRPLGRFDYTGWNYILEDSLGEDIGVILDPDHSGKNRVDTVWFETEQEFPLLTKEIDYDLSHEEYIEKYKGLAKNEEAIYGIPAAITLAQGILESNSGSSFLARNANNHFGMKCFSKRCKKDHCINRTDDSHKDFFLKFKSVEDSYRSHSKLLKRKQRYAKLFQLPPNDYKGWADGLQEAGYATSRVYAKKLKKIIKQYELDKI